MLRHFQSVQNCEETEVTASRNTRSEQDCVLCPGAAARVRMSIYMQLKVNGAQVRWQAFRMRLQIGKRDRSKLCLHHGCQHPTSRPLHFECWSCGPREPVLLPEALVCLPMLVRTFTLDCTTGCNQATAVRALLPVLFVLYNSHELLYRTMQNEEAIRHGSFCPADCCTGCRMQSMC